MIVKPFKTPPFPFPIAPIRAVHGIQLEMYTDTRNVIQIWLPEHYGQEPHRCMILDRTEDRRFGKESGWLDIAGKKAAIFGAIVIHPCRVFMPILTLTSWLREQRNNYPEYCILWKELLKPVLPAFSKSFSVHQIGNTLTFNPPQQVVISIKRGRAY